MSNANGARWSHRVRLIALGLIVSCSLVLTAAVNYTAGMALNFYAPNLAWIATAAIPSAALIMMIYVALGKWDALGWPRLLPRVRRQAFTLSAIWLLIWMAGFGFASLLAGKWINYATGFPFVAAFIVFGPIGEELLFRGLIFEKARDIWPATALPAVCISTVAFSLHHIALGSAPQGIAAAQLIFTIPMGFVLAVLRERTGSILPGWLLHIVTNLPAIF